MDVNQSLMIEGGKNIKNADALLKEYDHPSGKKYEKSARMPGHGGMDWFVVNSFIEGAKPINRQIDVYDAATWLAITVLSEQSIALQEQCCSFDFLGVDG